MRRLVGAIIKANNSFNIIKNHDSIGVGVSGGKDSTLLFYALKLYADYMKRKHGWNLKVYGIHVIMNYYPNIKYGAYKKWLKDHDLQVKFIGSTVGDALKAHKSKKGKVQCSLCAKLKKAIMVKEAKKLKINKLATGHHVDDAIETLFMNMINEGRLNTFSPDTFFDRNGIHLIRPFILVKEEVTRTIAKQMKIPVIVGSCPNEFSTQRMDIKNMLEKQFYKKSTI